MSGFFERTKLLVGDETLKRIGTQKIAIFGLGGVGTYVLEALARLGVSNFLLVDKDKIEITNINRQILALNSTIGESKVAVAKNRILDINPKAKVEVVERFYKNQGDVKIDDCDFVIDAMDTISSKLNLVEDCKKKEIRVVGCMGTANRLDPTKFLISDIYDTSMCPVCKIIRHELRKRHIKNLDVVYSTEVPVRISADKNLGSISFVPSSAGLLLTYFVFKNIV